MIKNVRTAATTAAPTAAPATTPGLIPPLSPSPLPVGRLPPLAKSVGIAAIGDAVLAGAWLGVIEVAVGI